MFVKFVPTPTNYRGQGRKRTVCSHCARLLSEYGFSTQEIGNIYGVSRQAVNNSLRQTNSKIKEQTNDK